MLSRGETTGPELNNLVIYQEPVDSSTLGPLANLHISMYLSFPKRIVLTFLLGLERHPKSVRSNNLTNKGIIDVTDALN